MPIDHRKELKGIKRFDQLVRYLRDPMGWPIESDDFEELTFEYTPEELGIDTKNAAKIQEIKRLRPLAPNQPWGIFFVKFEPRRLPVVALRRILSQVALKKRASANKSERQAWAADDLLFVSNYGEGEERRISFAHFSASKDNADLPTLKVLGWDNLDTALHLDDVADKLTSDLAWPEDDGDEDAWRQQWQAAFTLRHREVITTSQQLSERLAKLARNIRDRIKAALAIETETGPLTKLMKAFQTLLVHDLDANGFADMYAQTIAYGLLSARIADPHKKTVDDFAGHMRTNPFLKELMETFIKVGGRRGKAGGPGIDFDELGVSEVVELLDQANMEAVVRDFGDRNPQEDPVIHFYEHFLAAYDRQQKVSRGVFYTPRPVVSYIVRSVDELLRTEFGLEDGLADIATWGEMVKRHKDLRIPDGTAPDQAFVQILDPATGTGTFLVEVIDLIHKTMVEKWKAQGHGDKKVEALWNEYVPEYLLPRLHGYELLMAPYAIAHLKVGLKLYETGYRFGSEERARVYLTNALEPVSDSGQMALEGYLPALAHEAKAVNAVKRNVRFNVVIGNPPYSILSGNLSDAARSIVDRYKICNGSAIRERGALQFEKNLQNDYVKFLRYGELHILASGTGVLGYITSHAFLTNRTLRGMRESLLESFTRISIFNLHGNSASGEAASLCGNDENVFDIIEGVSISVMRRACERADTTLSYADLAGPRGFKYSTLSQSTVLNGEWQVVSVEPPNYILKPQDPVGTELRHAFSLDEIFRQYSAGIITARDAFATDESQTELINRVESFATSELSGAMLRDAFKIKDKKGWDVDVAKAQASAARPLRQQVKPYLYRPFDSRFIAYNRGIVWGMAFPTLRHTLDGQNLVLVGMKQYQYDVPEYCYTFVSRGLTDHRICVSKVGVASLFPLYLSDHEDGLNFSDRVSSFDPGFVRSVLQCLGLRWVQESTGSLVPGGTVGPEDVFFFIYAQLHSRDYRRRYAEFLKSNYPHVFLTNNLELFRTLARLGHELVGLHLFESNKLAEPITELIGGQHPVVEKMFWLNDVVWLDKSRSSGFRGVRKDVWDFRIGGYQVCHKWLKDRKGRTLSDKDIAHFQKIVVALAETIRLMKEIDEVIEKHGGWPGAFQTGEAEAAAAKVLPFRPRAVEPKPEERYVTCVPLVPLKAAAGAFSDLQHIEDDGFEWVAVESRHRLRKGMFVAQIVGKSMEPAIPDGAWCLFRSPVEGSRQGKTVLVQLRDASDPETGQRYTVKRYESEKVRDGDTWRHAQITLKPVNPDFDPIVLSSEGEGELQAVAELVEVLRGES